MIISRTPYRISFFGGGSDYPAFYREHGGAVLSATINKYCYVTCRTLPPFFDHKYRIRYCDTEAVDCLDSIRHPLMRECMKFVGVENGLEVVHTGDIPDMSGVGSSSSLTVGLLHALYSLKGVMPTKRKLALDAIDVEQNRIGENVGSQDQVAAAFGGFNKIVFGGCENIFIQPITLCEAKLAGLQSRMLLYFTGISRRSTEVAKSHVEKIPRNTTVLRDMAAMVDEAIGLLNGGKPDYDAFGKLLHQSWMLKKALTTEVSNGAVDDIYEAARRAGALGGKLCGAGGGGFILIYARLEDHPRIREALKDLLLVPFRFETLGSHIIFYST